jgi:hypothetical protein
MNLNAWKLVVIAQRPSLSSVITHLMSYTWLVNGAAIEASASLKLMPTSAALSAPQSFAPSPHIPICWSNTSYNDSINFSLSSGLILANTEALAQILLKV